MTCTHKPGRLTHRNIDLENFKIASDSMKISLQDFAYAKCQELIQKGGLVPGQLYSEVALSKELNISRTPLRGAVQRLEKEGLVTRYPQRGFTVTEFTKKDIKELFDIRKAIEGFAAENLALNPKKFDLAVYKEHVKKQESVSDLEDYQLFIDADKDFHEDMVKALDNKRLLDMYGDLRQSIAVLALKRFKITSQRTQSLIEHKNIINAIQSGDPVSARNAVYQHMDSVIELLELFEDDEMDA